jgi:hypothetical protein
MPLESKQGPSLDPENFVKKTVNSPSHRIFGRMHEALNIDKK